MKDWPEKIPKDSGWVGGVLPGRSRLDPDLQQVAFAKVREMTSSVRKRQHRVALGLKVKDGDVSLGGGWWGVGGVGGRFGKR